VPRRPSTMSAAARTAAGTSRRRPSSVHSRRRSSSTSASRPPSTVASCCGSAPPLGRTESFDVALAMTTAPLVSPIGDEDLDQIPKGGDGMDEVAVPGTVTQTHRVGVERLLVIAGAAVLDRQRHPGHGRHERVADHRGTSDRFPIVRGGRRIRHRTERLATRVRHPCRVRVRQRLHRHVVEPPRGGHGSPP
jgi:hypothetical protein